MPYFAAILYMLDKEKNLKVRPRHIEYLDRLAQEGKIFARGPFSDDSGGLVVYIAESYEEALSLAEKDPHVVCESRRLELKEWKVV